GLYRNRIRFDKVWIHQWQKLVVELPRPLDVRFEGRIDQSAHHRGSFIGNDGDDPITSQQHNCKSQGVVATQHSKMARGIANDVHDLGEISRSLLHRDYIGNFREPKHRFGFDVSTRSSGHIVDDDWNVFSFGNGLEVFEVA